MSKLEQLIESFNAAFYSDDFGSQVEIYRSISEIIDKNTEASVGFQESVEFKRFKLDMEHFEKCGELLNSDDDWSVVRENDNIKVEKSGGGADFMTRCTANIEKDIFSTFAVLSEIDLVPTWVDSIKEVIVYSEPCKTRRLVNYHMSFPWPLSDRELIVTFTAVPNPEDKSCTIVMATPTEESYLNYQIPPVENGRIRMNVPIGCLFVKYLSPTSTKVVVVCSANANIVIIN